MRNQTEKLNLVAEVAVAGLNNSPLTPEDRADFFDGLSLFLGKHPSDAAKYAATCIREGHRAQQDFLAALATKKGGAV